MASALENLVPSSLFAPCTLVIRSARMLLYAHVSTSYGSTVQGAISFALDGSRLHSARQSFTEAHRGVLSSGLAGF